MDDILNSSIHALGALFARKELSPVELCTAFLARCERDQGNLNAFIYLSADRVLEQARCAEREIWRDGMRGPLHGVPIAIKDNINVAGEPTSGGSKLFEGTMAESDASVVARLRRAGAIVFGKTNLPELAYGPINSYHFGPSRNPWDRSRYAGGSSMGSGAAVAGGLVAAALGSDTSGSIRNPATWCGVVGLCPTMGRVSASGTMPLARSLDRIGPIARSAEDCAIVYDAIAGYDDTDPLSIDVAFRRSADQLSQPLSGMKVGLLDSSLWQALAPAITTALKDVLQAFRLLGLQMRSVELVSWHSMVETSSLIMNCEAAMEYGLLLDMHAGGFLPEVRERLEKGCGTPATDYIDAQRACERFRREFITMFNEVDLIILPARDRTAPRMTPEGKLLDQVSGVRFTSPINLAGVPALTIPCGFDQDGLPIGVQLVAPHWQEARLLAVAHAYQQLTDWHSMHPPLTPASHVTS